MAAIKSKTTVGGKKGDLLWVLCDTCSRMELYENTGIVGRENVDTTPFECKLCKQELEIRQCLGRIKAVEDSMLELAQRVDTVEGKFAQYDTALSKKVECDVVETFVGKVEACDSAHSIIVVQLSEIEAKLSETMRKVTALEFPPLQKAGIPTCTDSSAGKKASSEGRTKFCEMFKGRSSKTAVVIGDSMCRGAGKKLCVNSQMFSSESYGGARIENITKKFTDKMVGVSDESHAVVMVGTNNLKTDGTSVIESKYRELLKSMTETRCRKKSVVGILRRANDGLYMNSKRLAVNDKLRKLCKEFDVEYIDPQDIYDSVAASKFNKSSRVGVDLNILDRWGLHLNEWGQDELAAVLFKHCVGFLY